MLGKMLEGDVAGTADPRRPKDVPSRVTSCSAIKWSLGGEGLGEGSHCLGASWAWGKWLPSHRVFWGHFSVFLPTFFLGNYIWGAS